ncbi:MAG: pimeloyl-ACP methyl ester carboxylesterase [Polyangiales bacterium]|jgi:pimeloyl-ACP methyl ester carboxylesterase
MAALGRWLGPWTPDEDVPPGIRRREITLPPEGGRRIRAWTYRGNAPLEGAILVVPGLHYLGPADPRLDRFCRVLASARMLVLCPFLPDFEQMIVAETLGTDALRAYDTLCAHPETPRGISPGVFSISFGSLPALRVAASRDVGALMLFGGYAEWTDAVRFSLTGNTLDGVEGRPYDPLNRPVVFNNMLPFIDNVNREAVQRAILEQVRITWGNAEMKAPGALRPSALRLADSLPDPASKRLFLQATGLEEGGDERVWEVLDKSNGAFDHLNPTIWAKKIEVRAVVAHGREDDVIPVEHAEKLAAMIPKAETFITGTYAHTGKSTIKDLLPRAQEESEAMIGLLRAMARTGCVATTHGSY